MRETLGHYRLLREIGRGAMGEVYLAEDTKLGRQVALKLLPSEVAGDAERLARFAREAKAAATINHPGVVTLYSIEETQDEAGQAIHFLTMELVDGKPLSACIKANGSSVAELLDWGVQLSDAVAAAHAEGITHRDLKPANIMLTGSGRIKILDFGLAREETTLVGNAGETDSPTAAAVLTRDGRILGTPAYMSPEQAEGSPVDHRTDIFSLGILLFELAIGKRPFVGTSSSGVISAILRDEPASLTDLRPELPVELARIVRRCLSKTRDRRFQTALDVRNELDELRLELDSGSHATGSGARSPAAASDSKDRRPWLALSLAAAAIAAAAVIGFQSLRERSATAREVAEEASGARPRRTSRLTDLPGQEMFPNLSSDGTTVVFAHKWSENWGIFRQRIGGTKAIDLTTDHAGDDTMPALSPNDELIAFRSERDGGGLYVMGATGESVRRVSDFGYNPSWAPDNRRLVFAKLPMTAMPDYPVGAAAELWVVDIVRGQPERLEGAVGAQPAWSPNGHRIAYFTIRESRNRDIVTIAADGGQPVSVTNDTLASFSPSWSPDGGDLYYRQDGTNNRGIVRVAIDERTGRVSGEPRTVTETTAGWHYHLSVAGSLGVYTVRNQRVTIESARLHREPGQAAEAPRVLLRDTEHVRFDDCSPDGSRLLVVKYGGERRLISMNSDGTDQREIARGILSLARWSPDGERIALNWMRDGNNFQVYTMRPDGGDLLALTHDAESVAAYPVWSPDGRRIAYWSQRTKRIHTVASDLSRSAQPLNEQLAGSDKLLPRDWSPDGTRLLCEHDDGGVVVLDLATGSQRHVLDSGKAPRWLTDSEFVYHHDGDLYRYHLETGDVELLIDARETEELDQSFAIGPGGATAYYARADRQYDIWTVLLD